MPIGERRKGRVGIFATIILMFSVVIFISSLFYLTTNSPWNSGPMFGREKYVTTSISDKQTETQQLGQELNLTIAVADLESAGCVFTVYTGEYIASSCIKLEYNKFREEAINRKIVYIAEREQDNTFLLIEKKGQLFEWSP